MKIFTWSLRISSKERLNKSRCSMSVDKSWPMNCKHQPYSFLTIVFWVGLQSYLRIATRVDGSYGGSILVEIALPTSPHKIL